MFVLCGGLSWLHLSFLMHIKYTVAYHILSYVDDCVYRSLSYQFLLSFCVLSSLRLLWSYNTWCGSFHWLVGWSCRCLVAKWLDHGWMGLLLAEAHGLTSAGATFDHFLFWLLLRPKAETETHTEGLTRSQSRAQINQFYLAQTHWSPAGTVVAYLLGLAKKWFLFS